jgi:nucleoside diphosphate kinase
MDKNENISHVDFENELRHKIGVVLVKPDAVESGVAEEIIAHVFDKLKVTIPDIALEDVVIVPSFKPDEVEKIYPNLKGEYQKAVKTVLSNGPSVAVYFSSKSGDKDIWESMYRIRGKVKAGHGIEDSIRAIIPLPGDRKVFEEISTKIKSGEQMTDADYENACKNLIHVPDDMKEFASLSQIVNSHQELELLKKSDDDFTKSLSKHIQTDSQETI